MQKVPLYKALAHCIVAIQNCEKSGNTEWRSRHADRAFWLVKRYMPSGSGFDCGTSFCIGEQKPERLIFSTSFHHMDENGSYDGWTEHEIWVKSSLAFTLDIRITGRDRNDLKSYMHEVFRDALEQEIEEYPADAEPKLNGRQDTGEYTHAPVQVGCAKPPMETT